MLLVWGCKSGRGRKELRKRAVKVCLGLLRVCGRILKLREAAGSCGKLQEGMRRCGKVERVLVLLVWGCKSRSWWLWKVFEGCERF